MSKAKHHADDARRRIVALPPSFEESETLRSSLIRDIVVMHLGMDSACRSQNAPSGIPRNLIRFWHDQSERPDDVTACMSTWERLVDHGFAIQTFDDVSADRYIRALETCGGYQTRAAELLGGSRRTLINRLDRWKLPRPQKR